MKILPTLDERAPAGTVDFAARSPFSPRALRARVPEGCSVREAVDTLRARTWGDPEAQAVADQLGRELSAEVCQFLSGPVDGRQVAVPPRTPVREIAVPTEVRDDTGVIRQPFAEVEVQSYAPVGVGIRA